MTYCREFSSVYFIPFASIPGGVTGGAATPRYVRVMDVLHVALLRHPTVKTSINRGI